jgi:hypothetical protein
LVVTRGEVISRFGMSVGRSIAGFLMGRSHTERISQIRGLS